MSDIDLHKLFAWVFPEAADCADAARQLRLESPDLTNEQLARRAVKDARRWAVSIGAITGLAASPLSMVPAAVADAAGMLRLEGKLAGTVAALLDPESLNDREIFRRDIIRAIFPGAVSQAMRKLGVRAGEEVTKSVVRKMMTNEAGKEIGERAVKFLGIRLSEKAVTTKTVPIIGAGIGAAWNWIEIQAVGHRAVDYHLGITPPATRARKKVVSFVREQAGKFKDHRKK